MSRVDDQARQQILTRVAASRVRVVDAVDSVRKGVCGTARAFPLSATALKMTGVALGGLVLTGIVAGKIAGKKAKKVQPRQELKGRTVALQALSAIAIPLLQRWLTARQEVKVSEGVCGEPVVRTTTTRFAIPDINGMFYRWLGLQK